MRLKSLVGGPEDTLDFQLFVLHYSDSCKTWLKYSALQCFWKLANLPLCSLGLDPAPGTRLLAVAALRQCGCHVVLVRLHSQSFDMIQTRDEFQMVFKILCYYSKSLGFFPFALFWVDS